MKIKNIFLISILSIASFGCNTTQTKDTSSQFYSIPAGSELSLNKKLVIKANTGRTFLQNGNVVNESNLNIYYPHCSITVNTINQHNISLNPTTFMIYKVIDDEEEARRNILYASLRSMGENDGPTIIGQASYYYLRSADEPDVRTLECVQWGDPFYVKYVSIDEVKKALGDYFTLKLRE